MRGSIEYSLGSRSKSFPASWGVPPGEPFSEQRTAWVREQVERHNRRPEVALRRVDRVKWAESEAKYARALDLRDQLAARREPRPGPASGSLPSRDGAALLRELADQLERQ